MAEYRRWFWPAVLILLGGLALRLIHLNSLPIFADESIYIRWAQVMRAEPSLRFLPLSDGKQPLFMWVVIPFLKIFSDPLIAGRILSALCGLGTIVGIFAAAQILFKRPAVSVLAALIWAVLPYSVFFERMALVDGMLTLFVVWTFVFSSLALIHSRLDFAMLAGFSLGFAYLTKSPALFSFFLIPLFLLLVGLKGKSPLQLIKLAGLILATYVIGLGMYNILRLGPEFSMIAQRNQDYYYPVSQVIRHPWWPLWPHLGDDLGFFAYLFTPVALLLGLFGLLAGQLRLWRQRLILACWGILPVIAQSAIAISLTARYFLFALPFLVILVALGAVHLWYDLKKPGLAKISLALILLPAAVLDYLFLFRIQSAPLPRIERAGYLEQWTAGTGIKEASAQIRTFATAGPVLVGSEGFFGTPFNALQAYLNDLPQVRVIGVGVWIDSVSDKLTNALGDNQVFLVVNSSRFHADPAKLGLQLLASYPKAAAPDGTRESLLFFKVLPRK